MLSSRIRVAGAALVVGTVISSPVWAACDRSFPLTCLLAGSDQTAKPKSEAAPAHPRRASKRPTKAARSSERVRRHASGHWTHRVRTAGAEPHAAPAAPARPLSASARRFREFVNPRSIVMNTVDELKQPRPDDAALATSITFPTVAAKLQPPLGSKLDDVGSLQDALNEINVGAGGDRPTKVKLAETAVDGVPAGAPARLAEVRKIAAQDQAPGGTTWLQLIFVTWGGILTLASAARLLLG